MSATQPYLKFLLPGDMNLDSNARWLHAARGGLSWELDLKGERVIRCLARIDSVDGTPGCFLSGWDRGVRTPGLALRFVRNLLSGHLARLSAHEVNGKLMGVRGLLDTWRDASPDQDAIREDAPLLLAAFQDVRAFVMLMAWLLDDATQEERPLDLNEVRVALNKAILKFSPQGGVTSLRLEEKKEIIASPSAVVLWILGLARVIVDLRKAKEEVEIRIAGEEEAIQIEVIFPGIKARLSELHQEAQLSSFVSDWLLIFALTGGKVGKLEADSIILHASVRPIRLSGSEKKVLSDSPALAAQYVADHVFQNNPPSELPFLQSLQKVTGSCG